MNNLTQKIVLDDEKAVENFDNAMRIIERGGIQKQVFLNLFWNSSKLAEQMTADDCLDVFCCALKGSADLSVGLFDSVCEEYGTSLDDVMASEGLAMTPRTADFEYSQITGVFHDPVWRKLWLDSFKEAGFTVEALSYFRGNCFMFGTQYYIFVERVDREYLVFKAHPLTDKGEAINYDVGQLVLTEEQALKLFGG